MEEIFKKLGISTNTVKAMIEICPDIRELSKIEILEKIEILKRIKCDNIQIKNIISSNSTYLNRSNTDIKKLIKTMKSIGFTTLNVLFDGNPYILNYDYIEIEEYIKKREENGEQKEDIVNDMEANLYKFEEI